MALGRRNLARSVVWVVLVVLLARHGFAQDLSIAPGHEGDVLALFAPYTNGGSVEGGVRVVGVEIRGDSINVLLRDAAGGASGALVLRAHDAPGANASLGRSASFDLDPEPDPPPAALAASLGALASRVRENDHGLITRLAQRPRGEIVKRASPPPDSRARVRLASAGWLALLGLGVFALVRNRAALRSQRRTMALVAGVFALALAVRLATPATALHSNGHAIDDVRSLVRADGAQESFARRATAYGPSFVLPQRTLVRALGDTDRAVFLSSALWGALASALACAAALRWGGSALAGALGGVLHALAPVAVRVAHSESELVVGQCLVALILWLAAYAEAPRARVSLAGLGLAALLLSTGHLVGPVFAAAVLVFVAARVRAGATWPRRSLAVGALFLAPAVGLMVALSVSRAAVSERAGHGAGLPLVSLPWDGSLWFDAAWTPLVLPVLAAMGVVALVRAAPRDGRSPWLAGFTLFAGSIALLEAGQMVRASVADGLRYQSLLAPVWAVLGGAAWRWMDAERGRNVRAAVMAVVLVASMVIVASRGAYRWRDVEAEGYAVASEAIAAMPDRSVVIVPERARTGEGAAGVVFDVPDFAAARAGRTVRALTLAAAVRRRDAGVLEPSRTFAWRGPFCQAFEPGNAAPVEWEGAPIRPECAEMLRAFPWREVTRRDLAAPPPRERGTLPATFDPYVGTVVRLAVLREAEGAL